MKFAATTEPRSSAAPERTRDAVMDQIHGSGPLTAATLAERLDVSPAAVRRHLDALVEDGLLAERAPRPSAVRGRGRPARTYALTDAGRAAFPHAYDDLATTALRWLSEAGGQRSVEEFAEHRARTLADSLGHAAPVSPAELADGLTRAGYAASADRVGGTGLRAGTQVCQHHCPVAHVAAEFPQLCEAETRAFERVLGTYVQRLATIAHGDGVCTTHVPDVTPAAPGNPTGTITAEPISSLTRTTTGRTP